MLALSISIVLFLAYANGANDNFKGVATLFGSFTTDYRRALGWATFTTLLGSAAAMVLAGGLIATFSGRGLVPDHVIAIKSFSVSVGLAAATTVMLATRFGFPVSTTHALTGALMGAAVVISPVNFSKLGTGFFVPLLVSPLLAFTIVFVFYPIFRAARRRFGITKETCVCMGSRVMGVVPAGTPRSQALAMIQTMPTITVGVEAFCVERYQGQLLGITAKGALDPLHYISAGVVSFARGLNDTPKIAAMLMATNYLPVNVTIVLVAITIALGGWFHANAVAETMSHRVTSMSSGQGFTANVVTALLVISASCFGLPVSTTHVSCGALFGIGAITNQANSRMIRNMIAAWVMTLPLAAILGAIFSLGFGFLG